MVQSLRLYHFLCPNEPVRTSAWGDVRKTGRCKSEGGARTKPVPSKCCFGMGQWCSQSMGLGSSKSGNKPRRKNEAGPDSSKGGKKNSHVALDQDEYEKRYAELTARYEKAKAKYDDIAEQIESKKAKRELFKGFIRTLEKQDGLIEEFDAGIWGSLVQEVIVKSKDDIRFIFKNGFEVTV